MLAVAIALLVLQAPMPQAPQGPGGEGVSSRVLVQGLVGFSSDLAERGFDARPVSLAAGQEIVEVVATPFDLQALRSQYPDNPLLVVEKGRPFRELRAQVRPVAPRQYRYLKVVELNSLSRAPGSRFTSSSCMVMSAFISAALNHSPGSSYTGPVCPSSLKR